MFPIVPKPQNERQPILTFRLGELTYALLIDDVIEVEAMVERIPVLDAPPEILGLVNRHGMIVPLVDLRLIFKQPAPPVSSSSYFIVAGRHEKPIGLVVDEVHQVEYADSLQLEKASASGKYIRGMISTKGQLIPVIAADALAAAFLANPSAG